MKCEACLSQGDFFRTVTLSLKELCICRVCQHQHIMADYSVLIKNRAASDMTDYANACGYALEMPVIVVDGKVVSHRRADWFVFLTGCRQGLYAKNAQADDLKWQQPALAYLHALCAREYAAMRDRHLRSGKRLSTLKVIYSTYVMDLLTFVRHNDDVGFLRLYERESYAHVE